MSKKNLGGFIGRFYVGFEVSVPLAWTLGISIILHANYFKIWLNLIWVRIGFIVVKR